MSKYPEIDACEEASFQWGCGVEAKALVIKHHYSHRCPPGIMAAGTLHRTGGLFGDKGECIAACVFAMPPTRWAEQVIELVRLVRIPGTRVHLTKLIAKTVTMIRQEHICDVLVSFADKTHNHHGGIYQAASWHYHGARARAMDGLIIGGVFVPGRTCNARWGTRSPARLREIIQEEIEPHYDEGKHLYWKALSRRGKQKAARLDLQKKPYPKPDGAKTPTSCPIEGRETICARTPH